MESNSGKRTYIDPRLAFAQENLPQNIAQVRQRFDASTTALQVLHGRDLSGKVAIITGANAGIGFETARSLALHGCHVYFACRSQANAEEAIERIHNEKPSAGERCYFVNLDLTSLRSVQQCVRELKTKISHIDMLILNAGVFALPHTLTEDGLETIFQVSHISHFYLTLSLEEYLDHTSRVVVVSSESHRYSYLPTSHLNEQILSPPAQRFYSMLAYNNAKLCNVLFAKALTKVRTLGQLLLPKYKWRSKQHSVSFSDGFIKASASIHCIPAIWFHRIYRTTAGIIAFYSPSSDHSQNH